MNTFDQYEVWFVTGAQLLYGGDAVIAVDAHSNEMVAGLNASGKLPVKVVYKGTANSSKEVEAVFKAANNDDKCIGIITWMHTFSPAKMWIHGLQQLKKPLLHLHTQFNKEIPWDTMDMDFMNLNQSAHGDREFGHICTRMRIRRKVVVGYWKEESTQKKIAVWMRVCAAWADAQDMLIIRFGDQMNNVAVTDGDKVEAEQRMGYHVDYCPVSELMEYHKEVKDEDVDALVKTYFSEYDHDAELEDKSTEAYQKVWNSAKAELALRAILKAKGAKGFTTNFDDLGQTDGSHFDQIPGLASQRLMAEGYGFGAEGDWKSAALYRTVWVMNQGLPNGCSFLEDYTLNFDGENSAILQAHMLEVCPLIAAKKPRLEVHFLGIGIRKAQAARDAVRRAVLCDELAAGGALHRRGGPRRVVITRLGPAVMLQTGIVMLTQIYLIAHDGAALHAPRRIAGDDLARAVLILDLDLAHESRRAVAQRRPILNHVIETVAENRTHGIGTLAQQRLQVVAYVHDRIFTEGIRHHDRTRTQFRAAVVVCLVGRQVILAVRKHECDEFPCHCDSLRILVSVDHVVLAIMAC